MPHAHWMQNRITHRTAPSPSAVRSPQFHAMSVTGMTNRIGKKTIGPARKSKQETTSPMPNKIHRLFHGNRSKKYREVGVDGWRRALMMDRPATKQSLNASQAIDAGHLCEPPKRQKRTPATHGAQRNSTSMSS